MTSRRLREGASLPILGVSIRPGGDDTTLRGPNRLNRLMRTTSILFHVLVWLSLSAITGWCWIVSTRAHRRTPASLGDIALQERVFRTLDGYQATLEVYRPLEASPAPFGVPRPAVLAIHGGSWIGGSMRLLGSNPESTIIRLAQAGLVVIAVDYRLARPGCPSWPGAARRPARGGAMDAPTFPRTGYRSRSDRRTRTILRRRSRGPPRHRPRPGRSGRRLLTCPGRRQLLWPLRPQSPGHNAPPDPRSHPNLPGRWQCTFSRSRHRGFAPRGMSQVTTLPCSFFTAPVTHGYQSSSRRDWPSALRKQASCIN